MHAPVPWKAALWACEAPHGASHVPVHQLWVWAFDLPRPHPQLVYEDPRLRRVGAEPRAYSAATAFSSSRPPQPSQPACVESTRNSCRLRKLSIVPRRQHMIAARYSISAQGVVEIGWGSASGNVCATDGERRSHEEASAVVRSCAHPRRGNSLAIRRRLRNSAASTIKKLFRISAARYSINSQTQQQKIIRL